MSEVFMRQQELPVAAAKRLREMIIEKQMQAGEKLPNESELGQIFGVSRSTVREAIKLLIAENVVEIQRGKGTFVTMQPGLGKDPLGLEFANQTKLLDNLMETRMMIEPQIAYLAAQRANQVNIDQLLQIIQKMKAAYAHNSNDMSYDVAFHTAVAECTQNDVLHRILPIICESIQEGYSKTSNVPGGYDRAIQCHTNIFEAIVNKNSQIAKTETEKHLRQTMEDMKIIGGKT